MSDPLQTLRDANPVPNESAAFAPGEDARLTQMVQSRMARPRRLRGPAVAVAGALAVAGGFAWVLLAGTEPPPTGTTVAVAEPTTAPTSATTVATSSTTTLPAAPPVVIEWTRIVVPGGSAEMKAISALGDGFVAVGWTDSPTEGDAAVWLSPDGETWDRVPDDGSLFGGEGFQNAMDVVVDGDRVVVAGLSAASDSPLVWLSDDAGETWRRIEPEGLRPMWSIAMVNGRFVAAGFGFWHSEDGISWTKVEDDLGVAWVQGIAVSPDGVVAVGGPANGEIQGAVAVSEVGVVWERIPHDDALFGAEPDPPTSQTWWRAGMNVVVWTGERFVAAGFAGDSSLDGAVWLSDDGRSWSLITDRALGGSGSQFVMGLASDGARLLAVGRLQLQDGREQALAWVSTDGGSSWMAAESSGSGFETPIRESLAANDVLVVESGLISVGFVGDSAAVWVGSIQE